MSTCALRSPRGKLETISDTRKRHRTPANRVSCINSLVGWIPARPTLGERNDTWPRGSGNTERLRALSEVTWTHVILVSNYDGTFKIIDNARDDFELSIKEALWIKFLGPSLNKSLHNSGASLFLRVFDWISGCLAQFGLLNFRDHCSWHLISALNFLTSSFRLTMLRISVFFGFTFVFLYFFVSLAVDNAWMFGRNMSCLNIKCYIIY